MEFWNHGRRFKVKFFVSQHGCANKRACLIDIHYKWLLNHLFFAVVFFSWCKNWRALCSVSLRLSVCVSLQQMTDGLNVLWELTPAPSSSSWALLPESCNHFWLDNISVEHRQRARRPTYVVTEILKESVFILIHWVFHNPLRECWLACVHVLWRKTEGWDPWQTLIKQRERQNLVICLEYYTFPWTVSRVVLFALTVETLKTLMHKRQTLQDVFWELRLKSMHQK